jgi:hypothetical protein
MSAPLLYAHVPQCPNAGKGHDDAEKRICDTVTLHWIAGGYDMTVGRWMAFALSDGTSDNVLYPSKAECVSHQKGVYENYLYMRLAPGGMHICEASAMLRMHRAARNRGFELSGERQIIPRLTSEDMNSQIRKLGG